MNFSHGMLKALRMDLRPLRRFGSGLFNWSQCPSFVLGDHITMGLTLFGWAYFESIVAALRPHICRCYVNLNSYFGFLLRGIVSRFCKIVATLKHIGDAWIVALSVWDLRLFLPVHQYFLFCILKYPSRRCVRDCSLSVIFHFKGRVCYLGEDISAYAYFWRRLTSLLDDVWWCKFTGRSFSACFGFSSL